MTLTLFESWEPNLTTASITFVTFISSAIYIYGTTAAIHRLIRKPKVNVSPDECKISVLKPMSGLDPQLEENLNTFARLQAPAEFEVIMCLASERDAAYPVAKTFVERHPDRFKLVLGAHPTYGNAKMAQLSVCYPHAKNDFIWISESNVETSQEFMHALLATWKEANLERRRPTFVHAPLVAVGGRAGVGGALERMHLSSFLNSLHEASLLVGKHALVGKTEFMHRDDLALVGGIDSFANYLGEDYMLARAFQNAGVVRCSSVPTRNVIGRLRVKDWFGRHARWGVMRKTMEPLAFHSVELMVYSAIPYLLGIFGVISARAALSVLAIKVLVDGVAFSSHSKERPRVGDLLVIPLKDFLLFAAWIHALTTFHVKWHDKVIRLGRNTEVLTRTAEPSKLRRHWKSVKHAFVGR